LREKRGRKFSFIILLLLGVGCSHPHARTYIAEPFIQRIGESQMRMEFQEEDGRKLKVSVIENWK
jgi:hypothetical protein